MNDSVSPAPREAEVQSKVQKIRDFSRGARTLCVALFGLGLVACFGWLLFAFFSLFAQIPAPQEADGGVYDLLASPLTPLPLKVWWLVGAGLQIGVPLVALFQVYRLFGNLADGAIFTTANVRRVRTIGLLWLLLAVLEVVLPATDVVASRLFGAPVPVDFEDLFPSFGQSLSSLVGAGLVLLVSWIMDVGLYEKEHAEVLKRDADLMI